MIVNYSTTTHPKTVTALWNTHTHTYTHNTTDKHAANHVRDFVYHQ
jgi:hypothetical protein